MSTKFLLFVLGTMLLAQCVFANVIGTKSDLEEDSSPDAAVLHFFLNSLFRSYHLIDKAYNLTLAVLEPAVASFTVTNEVTKSPLQKNLEDLKEYFQKSNNFVADDEHKNKATFIQGVDKILDDIKETEKTSENLSVLESAVLKAVASFKTQFYKELETTVTHIVADAEDYWEEMGPSKRQEKQKFHATMLKLKNETDPEKKSELVAQLLESG